MEEEYEPLMIEIKDKVKKKYTYDELGAKW
jgi:hypothetical protein